MEAKENFANKDEKFQCPKCGLIYDFKVNKCLCGISFKDNQEDKKSSKNEKKL